MKRLLGGGAALALACVGVVVGLAGPTGAQEPTHPELAADLSPNPVEPGGSVSVSSVDPCPPAEDGGPGWMAYSVYAEDGTEVVTNLEILDPSEVDGEEGVINTDSLIVPGEDGSWQVGFDAPDAEGSYLFSAVCLQDSDEVTEIAPPAMPVELNPCLDELGFADVNPELCFAPMNPCDDEAFAGENPESCLDEDENPLNPCVDEEGFAAGNPELCFDPEQEILNPCDDEGFATDPENEGLCGEVDLCELDPESEACQPIEIVGISITGEYANLFEVAPPEARPAVPVPADPDFTG